jgi:hypothetical protein
MADVAAWYLALGAVALVALRRESWRIPVLALAFVQYALHSLNHLIDVGEAEPGWLGSANLVQRRAVAISCARLYQVGTRHELARTPGPVRSPR